MGTLNCGVYAVVNRFTGECYVGSAQDLYARRYGHRGTLRAGKGTRLLQAAYDRHGPDAFVFVVLCYVDEIPRLAPYEEAYILYLRPAYNLTNKAARDGSCWADFHETRDRVLAELRANGLPEVAQPLAPWSYSAARMVY